MYETTVLKILDNKQQKTVIPGRQETNNTSHTFAQLTALRVSRPWTREKEPRQSLWAPQVEEMELGVQGSQGG